MKLHSEKRPTESQAESSQWAVLGALRFFLALTVVFGHIVYLIGPDTHNLFEGNSDTARSAVWAFFVLSGFSIGASLEKNTTGFFMRRFVRIYPLYMAAIFLGIALYGLNVVPKEFHFPLGGTFVSPKPWVVISSLLMLQTIFGTVLIVWPSWSLSIEWWHYMLAPILRKAPNALLIVIAVTSWALYVKLTPGPVNAALDSIQFGWRAFATSWFWLLGFIFFRLRNSRRGLVLLLIPPVVTILLQRFIGAPFLMSLFVLLVSHGVTLERRWVAIFNWLGDVSYPIYLFHGMALIVAVSIGQAGEIRILAAVFVLSILALHVVDYPCRRFFKKRARTSGLVQQPFMAEK